MSGEARYAVYFAPGRASAFWRFGCAWLGRDPEAERVLERPPLEGAAAADWSAADLDALTASPRSYGFHATLKPPFRLASGRTLAELDAAVDAFAAPRGAFVCPDVRPAALGRFIAFRVTAPAARMAELAAAAVEAFDGFRAPPGPDELAKRRASGLTERQDALLLRWGYPYVMEEFRFHMTLTGPIADKERRDRLAAGLAAAAAAAGAAGEMAADGMALYEQPAPGAPFRLLRRFPFGA